MMTGSAFYFTVVSPVGRKGRGEEENWTSSASVCGRVCGLASRRVAHRLCRSGGRHDGLAQMNS